MKDHIRKKGVRLAGPREVGVRELKVRAAEIVRGVREEQARYTVTYRGRPVGLLLPVADARAPQDVDATSGAWDDLVRLGEEIGRGWRGRGTSAELLSKTRR